MRLTWSHGIRNRNEPEPAPIGARVREDVLVRDGTVVGTVNLLSRFPIKSKAGETLLSATVGDRGLLHDREWAVYTATVGSPAARPRAGSARLKACMMIWRSTVAAADALGGELPMLHSPDGGTDRVDDPAAAEALGRAFGQPLTPRPERTIRHHDECAVHMVTTSSIRRVEQLVCGRVNARRLRANVVLDTGGIGFVEDAWTDGELTIGPEVEPAPHRRTGLDVVSVPIQVFEANTVDQRSFSAYSASTSSSSTSALCGTLFALPATHHAAPESPADAYARAPRSRCS